jgi:hypothetical protein
MATTATRTELDEPAGTTNRLEATASAVSDVAGTVKDAAADAASRLPDVALTTRAALEDANRRIQAGTDEMLTVGAALSFGFAIGLLVGGANRMVVAAAFVPVATMGLTLLDRSSSARTKASGLKASGGL